MSSISLKRALILLQVKEIALILSISVTLPFLIHLIPPVAGVPLGAKLLPMFYAPFIALVLFSPGVALISALFSAGLNSLLTGHPLPEQVIVLTFELLLFTVISLTLRYHWKRFWGVAPLAYLITLGITCALSDIAVFFSLLNTALPGVGVLLLINLLLPRGQA